MSNKNPVGAVVVAAGRSSRMGAFKPLLPLGETTILETCINGLREGGVSDFVVVTGHGADRLRPLLERLGAAEVYNSNFDNTQMFDSACLGIANIIEKTDTLFFLPGDVAAFRPLTIKEMLAAFCGQGLMQPAYAGNTGHPILLGGDILCHILRHDGTMGLRGAWQSYRGPRFVLPTADPGVLLDADTPRDYQELSAYYRGRAVPDETLRIEILEIIL